jgi:hypothetical protein
MKPGGYTKWARKTIESDVFYWKPAEWFKIWFYIVNAVNYQDNKLFKRGEQFLKYETIAKATGTTFNQVHGFMRWAKEERMLTTRKTTRGMVVKVLNYAKYQDLDEYHKSTQKSEHKPFIIHTINKETKKTKKEEELPPRVKWVMEELGNSFRPTQRTIDIIEKDYGRYKITDEIKKYAAHCEDINRTPSTASLQKWLINAKNWGNLEKRSE